MTWRFRRGMTVAVIVITVDEGYRARSDSKIKID